MEPRFSHDFSQVPIRSRISRSNLTVAPANDLLESEADRIAETALRMPSSSSSTRRPQAAVDFSRVRIHTDAQAANSARAVNAKAYTVGEDIVFASGKYVPGTDEGRKLLAHELSHTLQQANGPGPKAWLQRTIGDGHDLAAPRFSGRVELEAAFDNERLIQRGSTGPFVRLIQESLLAQGYTLPQFGADGSFGLETEAAIRRFQRDAGATDIDGIVGPETMGLLDTHDPTLRTGPGPVANVGPMPGPRPAPAVGCDAPFAGVTFAVAGATGTGVAPAATFSIIQQGGRDFLFMHGIAHPSYRPQITIAAPTAARASEFEAGLIQNLLFDLVVYAYSSGAIVRGALPTPMKDGAPVSSGVYDTVFAENGRGRHPAILLPFTALGSTVGLDLPDVPSDGAFVSLLDNPECTGPFRAATLATASLRDSFRTWVGIRHRPSGCVRTIHHIDWDAEFGVTVNTAGAVPTATATTNRITVGVPNGNGSPAFVQGGRVPDDLLAANRQCQ